MIRLQLIPRFLTQKDYFKVLGVHESASQEEIRKQYLVLAKKYHPDTSETLSDVFKEVNEAYQVLKDEEKRKVYYIKTRVGASSAPGRSKEESLYKRKHYYYVYNVDKHDRDLWKQYYKSKVELHSPAGQRTNYTSLRHPGFYLLGGASLAILCFWATRQYSAKKPAPKSKLQDVYPQG